MITASRPQERQIFIFRVLRENNVEAMTKLIQGDMMLYTNVFASVYNK